MATIPINNETDYALTEAMKEEILRDAHEHFGSDVRLIRVQAGLSRHALNARTREVRYAFSPQDFGLGVSLSSHQSPSTPSATSPTLGRKVRRRVVPAPFEDSAEEEVQSARAVSLEALETGRDDGDVEEDDPYHADAHMDEDNFLESADTDAEEEDDTPPY